MEASAPPNVPCLNLGRYARRDPRAPRQIFASRNRLASLYCKDSPTTSATHVHYSRETSGYSFAEPISLRGPLPR